VTAPFGAPLLITNPLAGTGRREVLATVSGVLDANGLAHDVVETTAAGDATRLAREAVLDGRRFVVAVGGDGTVHEVVNGLVDAETGQAHADGVVLGTIAGGSGCDLTRTFGFDRRPELAARHLLGDTTNSFDLGRVRLTGPDGRPRTVVFANIAEAGYGGTVTDLANRLPRRVGAARYGIATIAAIARFRLVETTVRLDKHEHTEPLSNVVVANGQFFGGGMNVAPRALPWDGRFNVQAWSGRPIDVVRASPALRKGTHTSRPDVREWNSATVDVDGPPLVVEADGEVLGTTPATFDILPGVLRIKL
jgi:diacylglycerol kinase (ATP)